MKRFNSFCPVLAASLVLAVVISARAPLLAADASAAPARPMAPDSPNLDADQKIFVQEVLDRLVAINKAPLAQRLAKDFKNGRITFFKDENGVRASTTWHFTEDNTMELAQSTFEDWQREHQAAAKLRSGNHPVEAEGREVYLRKIVLDMALTVDHEYVHMDQYHPSEIPEKENPAWRHRIDEEKHLISESTANLEQLLKAPINSEADRQKVKTARDDYNNLIMLRGETLNEMRGLIAKGSLTGSLFANEDSIFNNEKTALYGLLGRANAAVTGGAATTPTAAPTPTPAATPMAKATPTPKPAATASPAPMPAGTPAAVPSPAATAMVPVPSVLGLTADAAQKVLAAANLIAAPQAITKAVNNVKPMVVFEQEPKAGAAAAAKAAVKFYYSTASGAVMPALKVPDVTHLTKEAAEAKLKELKFKTAPEAGHEKPPRTAKKQEVYKQTPQGGTEVAEGETIHFSYYAGFPVGQYVGMKKDDAEAAIKKDGLFPKVHEGEAMATTAADAEKVYQQNPAAASYAWFDDPVDASYYRPGLGFQEKDGRLVDPRFETAKISNGDTGATTGPRSKEPSAGERTEIYFADTTAAAGAASHKATAWFIRKYTDASGPKAAIAKQHKDGFFTVKAISVPGVRMTPKGRQVDDNTAIGTLDSSTQMGNISSHVAMIIYRDVFLISFSHLEPSSGYDFTAESANILRNSKQLIDERFPKK